MSTTDAVAKLTSKGQITLPAEVREALGVATGDRIEFRRNKDGSYVIRARKRRSILDIALENPLPPGPYDVDDAINEAMIRREKRSQPRRKP
jgi:antitoxin PrlF